MSNRYFHNKHEGNKGFAKPPQKKFVPKIPNSNQTLSNSIRQSDDVPSAVRVPVGGKSDSVSSKIPGGKFVNYLPHDEAVASGLGADQGGLDPVESQRSVDLLNKELSRLLKLNPMDFWREVASDTSLHAFLESFLKFKSRWYDFPYHGAKGILAGVIVGEYELSRRVFMVLYRISSNRDPGAKAADSLSPKDHSVILQEKKLLDLPKLLDICALYGHENEELTKLLVVNAIKAQKPWIHEDLTAVISHFLSIVNTMYQRCTSSLEVLLSIPDRQDHGSSRLHADYLEVMDFINDAIVSMDAFISAYNHAAIFFSCPMEMSYGNDELLITLAKLHDSLLPSLQRGFRHIFSDGQTFNGMLSNVAMSLKMLSNRIVKLGWKLLYFCYLSDEVFKESFPFPAATKIFPAQVEDPVIRADILVQIVREISEGYVNVLEGKSRGTFLQSVDKNHKLMGRIELLRSTGWIVMDDQQFHFLCGSTSHPLGASNNVISYPPTVTTQALERDEDTAIIESKISQIKDLFPDYGKGFLSACLEVYNQNPEEVIQQILEGTLHKDLQSLDTSLETAPHKPAPSTSRPDKGKGKLIESTPAPSIAGTDLTKGLAEAPAVSSSSSVGRFVRKSTTELDDILDSPDEESLAKTAAFISELEYEDEYDDSFDDLGLSVADSGGLEETETISEKLNLNNRGKSWDTDPAASSKWGSRKKPQFYVKDGKNYSYKVAGSIAVANYNEASVINQAQREMIHGLGRGGNRPLGALKKVPGWKEEREDEEGDDVVDGGGRGYPGNFRGRGRRGGGGRNHRKDQAMKKHFSGLTGH
ncbi:hypothetical protein LguiB_017372 [Lonicera macranthoides]